MTLEEKLKYLEDEKWCYRLEAADKDYLFDCSDGMANSYSGLTLIEAINIIYAACYRHRGPNPSTLGAPTPTVINTNASMGTIPKTSNHDKEVVASSPWGISRKKEGLNDY